MAINMGRRSASSIVRSLPMAIRTAIRKVMRKFFFMMLSCFGDGSLASAAVIVNFLLVIGHQSSF